MELRIERVAEHLAERQPACARPLCAYLYDLEALLRHSRSVAASLPQGCELYYAIKANSELPILQTLESQVAGFEVSSGGELAWVREHFPTKPVIFSGPGKTDAELELALSGGIDSIHLESVGEMQRLGWLAEAAGRRAPVSLRVNLPVSGMTMTSLVMGGTPSPFGIAADQVPACLDSMRRLPGLQFRGFHFHLLSHQLDAINHLQIIRACLDAAEGWRSAFDLRIEHVNVGGGIGINYKQTEAQFDLAAFSDGLKHLGAGHPALPRLRFEMGRYISAACGYYAMQVLDLKQAFGRDYVVARGGTHHFRTPCAQGHSHPFHVLPVEDWPYPWPRPELNNTMVNVVGQLCTPKDVLAFGAPVERVRVGDLLLFPYAGAYAWHISHHDFLRHPPPEHWFLPVEASHAANQ